jgi:hypothetical protein
VDGRRAPPPGAVRTRAVENLGCGELWLWRTCSLIEDTRKDEVMFDE